MSDEGDTSLKPQNDGAYKEAPEVERPKSKILSFLSHPAVVVIGLIGAIASLVGIPLSVYLYYAARAYPELTYYVNPVKATIVRAGEASKLTTSFETKPVTTDVTAAQIAIWNQGNQAIRKDHILKPVVIYTDNNTPILEATIRKSSRDVVQLSLNTEEIEKGRVTVFWNILEHNDGGIIQLIYAGNTNVNIQAGGTIEGQPEIEQLEFSGKIRSPSEQYESQKGDYKFWGYLLFGIAFLLVLAARKVLTDKGDFDRFYDGTLKRERNSVKSLSETIEFWTEQAKDTAEHERRYREYYTDKNEPDLRYKKLAESQQESHKFATERLEYYKSERDSLPLKENKIIADKRKAQKFHLSVFFALTTVIIGAILIAIYLVFVKQPLGPPFGF